MALLFILGVSLVLLAILLVGSALSQTTESGVTRSLAVLEAMTNAPKELTKDLDRSFADRERAGDAALGRLAQGRADEHDREQDQRHAQDEEQSHDYTSTLTSRLIQNTPTARIVAAPASIAQPRGSWNMTMT